jgi:hypothetical protein
MTHIVVSHGANFFGEDRYPVKLLRDLSPKLARPARLWPTQPPPRPPTAGPGPGPRPPPDRSPASLASSPRAIPAGGCCMQ